jgi:dTDP-4-dehydrorhamnose reductase
LILGGGYVGSYLSRYLSNQEFHIDVVNSKLLNYHDSKTLYNYLLNNNYDTVINCSGFTGRPNVDEAESKKELCWQLNVVSPLNVADICKKLCVKYIHISSGCIYSGYEKDYTEDDKPNFGLFDTESSFYSKSKHAFEVLSKHLPVKILRVRMPICPDLTNGRNYINKIVKYPNLINYKNSKTYLPDLSEFILRYITENTNWVDSEVYNLVNPEPLTTKQLISELQYELFPYITPNWVNLEDLDIKTSRSNCILDGTKANKFYKFRTELEMVKELEAIHNFKQIIKKDIKQNI